MNATATTCTPRLPRLWTPPHRRAATALSGTFWRLVEAGRDWARRRREQADAEVLDELDDLLRRDLGLAERRAPRLLDWSSPYR